MGSHGSLPSHPGAASSKASSCSLETRLGAAAATASARSSADSRVRAEAEAEGTTHRVHLLDMEVEVWRVSGQEDKGSGGNGGAEWT